VCEDRAGRIPYQVAEVDSGWVRTATSSGQQDLKNRWQSTTECYVEETKKEGGRVRQNTHYVVAQRKEKGKSELRRPL